MLVIFKNYEYLNALQDVGCCVFAESNEYVYIIAALNK